MPDRPPAATSRAPTSCIHRVHRPGLPVGLLAEPFRRRHQLALRRPRSTGGRVMVGLADDAGGLRRRRASRPSRWRARSRGSRATTGCRSTARSARGWPPPCPPAAPSSAARLHAPEAERALLRRLRIRYFSGELLDEPETIHGAAARRGHRPGRRSSAGRPSATSTAALRGTWRGPPPDARRARARRTSSPTGRAAGATPARPTRSCRVADDVRIAVPGFQPFAAYDVVARQPRARGRPARAARRRRRGPRVDRHAARHQGGRRRLRHPARGRARGARARRRRAAVGFDGFWTLPRRLAARRSAAASAASAAGSSSQRGDAARRRRQLRRPRRARSAPPRRARRRPARRRCRAACRRSRPCARAATARRRSTRARRARARPAAGRRGPRSPSRSRPGPPRSSGRSRRRAASAARSPSTLPVTSDSRIDRVGVERVERVERARARRDRDRSSGTSSA